MAQIGDAGVSASGTPLSFPALAAEVKFIYGIPSEVLLADSDLGDAVAVLNDVGARQGCPFGTFLFALVLHPILLQVADEFPTLEIASFADDAWFIAEPEVCVQAHRERNFGIAEETRTERCCVLLSTSGSSAALRCGAVPYRSN